LIEGFADELRAKGVVGEKGAGTLLAEMEALLAKDDFAGLKKLIEENKIKCPISGTSNWTDIRQFNLMFSTEFGSTSSSEALTEESKEEIKLSPTETARAFLSTSSMCRDRRMKYLGIALIGKAFQNEIVPVNYFRMREFEQMEMQYFIRPGTQKEEYEKWKQIRLDWHLSIFPSREGQGWVIAEKYRFHDHVKLAHYADAACDIEFEFPIGFKELEGIHSRTDFDLKQHQEYSKKKQQYFDNDIDPATGKPYGNYIPYVIETSIGLDRMFLAVISHAYEEQDLGTADKPDSRVVLKLPAKLAPIKLAVLPLTKKDGLPEIAEKIMTECKTHFRCFYEEKDSIGKRYRRMDALGTPFCVTVDHQSKEDNTVTIRHRDSMEQERISIKRIKDIVLAAIA
jgi:glycyl-tRNA synthetase